ncbi:MAG: hypothetical protein WEF28_09670 [Acidimicrobiia bacterium]
MNQSSGHQTEPDGIDGPRDGETGDHLVDVDDESTWPATVVAAVQAEVERLPELSAYTSDLRIDPDDGWFRSLFEGRLLLAYHVTRLLDPEVASIRSQGLRMLTRELVGDRLATAVLAGVLSPSEAEALYDGDVFASRMNHEHRQDRVCVFTSRTTLDNSVSGLWRPMATWGGEAIYFTRTGDDMVSRLRSLGRPAIIVVGLDIVGEWDSHYASPGILSSFAGKALGLSDYGTEIHYKDDIPAAQVLDIWQPGDSDYDRHEELAEAVTEASL